MKTNDFLKSLDQPVIIRAIAEAEARTSGQIRVFVSRRNVSDPLVAARDRFLKLGMEKTAERNGFLLYLAPEARKYAVVGDKGIHDRCGGDEYWQAMVDKTIRPLLKNSQYTEAIVQVIGEVGRQLAVHFPPRTDGTARNELPDDIAVD